MGRGGTPAREISFVSLVAYGPNSDSALIMGITASETRQAVPNNSTEIYHLLSFFSVNFKEILIRLEVNL